MMDVNVCDVVTPEIPITRGTDAGVGCVIRCVMRIINSYIGRYIRKKTDLKNHCARVRARSAEK